MNSSVDKDHKLGLEVHHILSKRGLENPIIDTYNMETIKNGVSQIIKGLGLDLSNESLSKTPSRVAEFFVQELFYGLDYANFPKISFNTNEFNYHEPLIAKNILFKSTCEHHFVSIIGKAHIAYIPQDKVIGLSKLNRVVDFFASRPQIQERITMQIFHALKYILDTDDIALMIKANHHCVTMRGVNDPDVENITYKLGGQFTDENMRRDFLKLIQD